MSARDDDFVIEVRDLTKRYGRNVVHEHLDFDVRAGEIVSIVGGSGSGKTTLVRQILGLERPSSGTIRVFGEDTSKIDADTARVMRSRSGMLFQHGALFSSLTVFDNVAQPLRELGRVPDDLLHDIVMLKLEMVGLPCKHASKMPAALSGGMVKRVGIARAIALEPELLFLDEPTAGLDPGASDEFVELIATLLQMRARRLHPSRNLDRPIDERFDWVRSTCGSDIRRALKLSIGFGGINTALCLERC